MRRLLMLALVFSALACGDKAKKTQAIRGSVVDDNLIGVGSVTVTVWSAGAASGVATTTASDGTFSADKITPPYHVVIGLPNNVTVVYLGISRADPAEQWIQFRRIARASAAAEPHGTTRA